MLDRQSSCNVDNALQIILTDFFGGYLQAKVVPVRACKCPLFPIVTSVETSAHLKQ